MLSALKRSCKHQRQRQAQKKQEKHTMFIRVGFTTIPPFFLLSFLPPKPGINSFKSLGNPLKNERDHSPPDLENLFFFLSFSFLLFLLFFLSHFSFTLHIFLLVFILHKHLSSLHFAHLQSLELPQSVSDFPSSINTPLFTSSKAGHINSFA